MDQGSKRLIDMTLDELDLFLRQRGYLKDEPVKEVGDEWRLSDCKEEELLRGDRELAEYLHISVTAVHLMKKSGRLDGTYANPTPRRYIYYKPKVDEMVVRRIEKR